MKTDEGIRQERRRCVAICRSRVRLWEGTLAARSSIPAAREEARARANEAAYIADLLESGADLGAIDVVDGDRLDA